MKPPPNWASGREPVIVVSNQQFMPTESWWAQPYGSRADFDQRVEQEYPRLRNSQFGRAERLSVGQGNL